MTIKIGCCSQKPIIELPAGEKLCKNHFIEYFENKVFRTIRQFDLIGKEENLGIALSGGCMVDNKRKINGKALICSF